MKAKYIGPNGIFDAGEECYRTLLSLPERLAIAAGISPMRTASIKSSISLPPSLGILVQPLSKCLRVCVCTYYGATWMEL